MASLQNTNKYVKFVRGTQAAWNSLLSSNQVYEDTLYFIYENSSSNKGALYLGKTEIGGGSSSEGGASTLDELIDVILSDLQNQDILVYNNGNWINTPLTNILEFDNSVLELDKYGALTLLGFGKASVGTIPQKTKTGKISWVAPGNLPEITEIQNQLTAVYTKEEVNNLIAQSNHLSYKKVGDLSEINPEAQGASNFIYLVPTGETSGNLYNEYMVFENKLEPVGSWEVNLDNYVTTTTFETKVSELNGLITVNKENIEQLQEFAGQVGDLSTLIKENSRDSLVDQVNKITQKLMWQEIVI